MTKLPLVPGTPSFEHARSPVALRTAQLATESALVVAHFEHRALLPWPEAFCPPGLEALAAPAGWQQGKLAEHPFQSFRHDRMTGSFHPGHRAKWTAHELVHLLVGFAYRPGASRYFHALSAWLAELLPVAVYYFFDEAGLRRCDAHAGGGPLYGRFCPACERAALEGSRPPGPGDDGFLRAGRDYLDAELAAFSRARRTGLPQGHRHATLDLCSDGIGYAAAHALRLDSAAFERFAGQFFGPMQGLHADLDALEARVLAVAGALLDGAPLPAWQADAELWMAQDVAYRLLVVHAETEGECTGDLDRLIDSLAESDRRGRVATAVEDYTALAEEWHLPEPAQLFALGYPVGELGSSVTQLAEGLASACPNTHAQLEDPSDALSAFAKADLARPERLPLGRRFARWLEQQGAGPLVDLARYEAALSHAAPADPFADALDAADPARDGLKRSEGLELVRLDHDVLDHDQPAEAEPLDPPMWLAIRTGAGGDLVVAELDDAVAQVLATQGPLDVEALGEAAGELSHLGFVVPARYRV